MLFLISLAAFAFVPFALTAMMPVRVGVAVLAGLFVAIVAFTFAMTGTDFPAIPASLIVSGAVSGLVTGGIRNVLRAHDAPWHTGAVTVAAGAVACVPVWLTLTFSAGMLVTAMSG
jgi:hypothetical protein